MILKIKYLSASLINSPQMALKLGKSQFIIKLPNEIITKIYDVIK